MEDFPGGRDAQAPPPPAAPAPGSPAPGAPESPAAGLSPAPAGSLAGRDPKTGRWLPGYSGNPAGYPPGVAKLRKMLVESGFDVQAVEQLKSLATSAKSERVRFAAVELAMNYIFGRPPIRFEGELEAHRPDGSAIVLRLLERRPELMQDLLDVAFPDRRPPGLPGGRQT